MSEESKNPVSSDEQIAMIEARLAGLTGLCGDHSCVFGPPKGLGTNGGCRCEVKRNPKVQQAIQLQRKLSVLLRERVQTQAESIVEFQRVQKELLKLHEYTGHMDLCEWWGSIPRTTCTCGLADILEAITPKGTN